MKHARELSGDRPVTTLEGMTPFAGLVIAALRGWTRGGPGAALVVLRERMSEAKAGIAMAALCDLAGLLCASRRRPLAARAPDDPCVGADEATFARFVQEAALGEREDALLLASLMVEAPAIMALTDAASRFGLHVHRALVSGAPGLTRGPLTVRTLH